MKLAILATLALATTLAPSPQVFDISGNSVTIPSPEGFAILTPEVGLFYRVIQRVEDPYNDLLATYLSESDISEITTDQIPDLDRYFQLKVNKETRHHRVSDSDFIKFKNDLKATTRSIANELLGRAPELFEGTNKGLSEEIDLEVAMSISQVVALDPHFETDDVIAYTMFMNYNAKVDSNEVDSKVACTGTFLNLNGSFLSLYCYSDVEDMDWTRSASKAWTEAIIAANTPSRSTQLPTGPGGILIAAAALVLIVVAAGIVMLSRKRSTSTPSA